MPRKPSKTFTDKELEIMQIIWEMGEASIKQIQERLPGNKHYNSILTIIRVLEQKGHLAHREEGRTYIYSAKEEQETARRRVLDHLVNHVFGGSVSSLLLNLVDRGDLTSEDLDAVRKRIKSQEIDEEEK
jgi:predicted transcriptional regulator